MSKLFDIGLGNNMFGYDTENTSNKSKNKQVGPNQTKKTAVQQRKLLTK